MIDTTSLKAFEPISRISDEEKFKIPFDRISLYPTLIEVNWEFFEKKSFGIVYKSAGSSTLCNSFRSLNPNWSAVSFSSGKTIFVKGKLIKAGPTIRWIDVVETSNTLLCKR